MDRVQFARHLRKNSTPAEKLLWKYLRLRTHGFKFRRQVPFGPYFLDFYCPVAKVCVEVDGTHHQKGKQKKHDKIRDAYLGFRGVFVVRLENWLVMEQPFVCAWLSQATCEQRCKDDVFTVRKDTV